LSPYKSVTTINAIFFAGGSAFGLSIADGVMRYLAEKNIGHPTPIRPIPIVAGAVVYDLFMNAGNDLPDAEMGYQACLNAEKDQLHQGNVGAGAGVTVGKWGGFTGIMKGGFGWASVSIDELIVGAAAAVNSVGDVLDSDGSVLAGARDPQGGWLVEKDPYRRFPDLPPAQLGTTPAGVTPAGTTPAGTNTTLVLVATNAKLDKVDVNKLAQRAHDGIAISIRPAHTTHDGDTAFALATGAVEAPFDLVANVAVEIVSRTIQNAVLHAETVGPFVGLAG
jgi:L-aminopeptidase/D-esterase-like protein